MKHQSQHLSGYPEIELHHVDLAVCGASASLEISGGYSQFLQLQSPELPTKIVNIPLERKAQGFAPVD